MGFTMQSEKEIRLRFGITESKNNTGIEKPYMKARKIKEQIRKMEAYLANAEQYLTQNVNIEGVSFLHFDDWKGRSGHPAWVRNVMIPSTKEGISKMEKTLDIVYKKRKDKSVSRRKRQGA